MTSTTSEALFANALNQISELGPVRLQKLKQGFGSFKESWSASESQLAHILGDFELASTVAKKRKDIDPENELRAVESAEVAIILFEDREYPEELRTIAAPPQILYVKGELPSLEKAVAVVGTRRPSRYGIDACSHITEALCRAGCVIVSGLARGIDTAAHEASLREDAKTVSVLGSGIRRDVVYPSGNRSLAEKIAGRGGAIISEYPISMKAQKWTFPQRNRIIAGLARGTLVVEANEKSGALITANYAVEAGRDVFAIPGSIFSQASSGPHKLLQTGALLVRSGSDILEALGIESDKTPAASITASLAEQNILEALAEPQSADEIIKKLRLDPSEANQTISLLEIRGMIRNMGGGIYRRT